MLNKCLTDGCTNMVSSENDICYECLINGGKKSLNRKTKGLSIEVEMNTDKLKLKLRVIAKHTKQLANELDAIDNEDDYLPTRLEGSE